MIREFQKTKRIVSRFPWRGESGQAFIEFTLVVCILMALIFGAIDFCRAIYMRQLLINLSRETANLEARGVGTTTQDIMTNALSAAVLEALPSLALDGANGKVIVTAVTNPNGAGPRLSLQYHTGSLPDSDSRLGSTIGAAPTYWPNGISTTNRSVYVAEIFYKYKPITPVGYFFKGVLPTQFYDAAYFSTL
jgi:hypothetical protein